MKSIEQFIEDYNNLSPEERSLAFSKYTMQSMSSFVKSAEDFEEATYALGVLTCAAILADDRISDEELLILYAGLKISLGTKADIEESKKLAAEILQDKNDYKDSAKIVAEKYLSVWNDNDKENVIMLCIALCAIDGVVSPKEILWLKELIAAANN
ncbi:MAG: hypothetical protein J1G02_00110 [Clostridiales bacterium]|nr:hypothetical protein [Clostridiales bacterium]